MTFSENEDLQYVENVVRVVNFQLERLENIAPVHKSEFRKCVDFFWGLVVTLGCFL